MNEEFQFPEEVPEELREIFTDDIMPLLPSIFEQAIAMLSPEHMERLEGERGGESGTLTLDEVMNADWELKEAFLQNVWGMLDQPPEYRDDSVRSIRALRSYEEVGDRRSLDEAISCLERIRGHAMFETDYEQARGFVLSNNGVCYLRRYELTGDPADLDLSIGILERVLAETAEDYPLRPGRLQNLATARTSRYARFGEIDVLHKAISELREAVDKTHELSPYLPGYLDSLGNALRLLYAHQGDLLLLDEALEVYWQATTKTPEDHPSYPGFLNNLGTIHSNRFERTNNREEFDESLRIFERATELSVPGSHGYVLHLANLGGALRTKFLYTRDPADLDKAIDAHRRVVDGAPEEPVMLAGFLSGLGSTLLSRVEVNGNLPDLEEAVGLLRRSSELTPDASHRKVFALNNLAYGLAFQHDMTGDNGAREELRITSNTACELSLNSNTELEEGLKCARSWGDWEFGWGSWAQAARAYAYAEHISECLLRIQLFREGKEIWLTELQGVAGRMAFALAKDGDLPAAVTAMERGRAKLLTETLDRDRADLEHLRETGQTDLYERYISAVEESSTLSDLASMLPEARPAGPPDAIELVDALKMSRDELDVVTEEIRSAPGYEQFQLPSSFEEIQSIAADTPLVYLTTTAAGSLVLVVTAEGARSEWLDITEQELDGVLVKMGPEGGPGGEPHMFPIVGGYVHAQIADSDHLKEALEDLLPVLGERIMATVAERLRDTGTQKAILIPNGQLGSVPLHAASYGVSGRTTCFLDEFDVSYAPNARSLGIARRSLNAKQTEPYLAGVGNPLPTSEEPLQWAQFELEGITSLFEGAARPLYGQAATKSALEAAMQDATYVHLACHGHFSMAFPPDSGLLLSNDEELTLGELLYGQVTVPETRLAVLSACQSAIAASGGLPDEYIGLPVGLLQVGIPGVVGTLWSVDDHNTALLMVKFYELHLMGDPARGEGPMLPAEALCEAQRWLRWLNAHELLSFLDDHPAVDRALRNNLRGNSSDLVYRAINDTSFEPDTPLFADEPALWAPFIFVGV